MARSGEAEVAVLLGGPKILGGISEAAQFVSAVRNGLPFASFEALCAFLGTDAGSLGDVLGIAPRTLARRKVERQLSPIESDRLYRIAYILHLAASTLGSVEKARAWLQRKNRTLGGLSPLSLVDTEIGERKVEEVLLQLSHGIYA